MALIECYECGKEISSIAAACPHCGAPANVPKLDTPPPSKRRVGPLKKLAVIVFWIFVGLSVIGLFVDDPDRPKPAQDYLASHATYAELDRLVGCGSTFSDDKKRDVFNERFKDHWFFWTGRIELVEADSVSLNIDGVGLQDLMVDFLDEKAGYDLRKGQTIKVRFLMKSPGGCFLPFSGVQAEVM
ncbi:zinc ribbon domain-containing protein [Stutzerimonas stutzeri]|uniref:zinc ribbon domain-containing protein n=1 Tax=Stutzerimonas stutzeri TaxID=316 RepID=UPI000F76C33D|nr:zinc ribbon domain-containing protein [Stutzerimonas stutzeri]MDH0726559.1 zinc ribbon domain-containing protein [Stutzerimonas stutzeri]RRV75038.1 zinc ribbon domain-containing protein [Stutzerimonas stutzeri]